MPVSERTSSLIIDLLILSVGAGATTWAARRIWLCRHSIHWPRAWGVVTRSEVVEDNDADGGSWFTPHVEYSFEVEGKQFTGTSLRFGFLTERFATRAEAEKEVAGLPVGKAVRVTYHPAQPTECILQPGLERAVYGVMAFGIAMSLLALWAFADHVRMGQ